MDSHTFPFDLGELGDSEVAKGGKISFADFMGHILLDVLGRLQGGDFAAWAVTLSTAALTSLLLYSLLYSAASSPPAPSKDEPKEEPIVPRDFTIAQLRKFNGEGDKKIYIALKGDVFDVTSAKHMYGPDGGYHCFAGRDATRAMARMSFEEEELSNNNPVYTDLSPFEKSTLNDWIEKFRYIRGYPIVGRLSVPPSGLVLTKEELLAFKGASDVPAGRVDAPIYICVKGDVFDVSYGGKQMYGEGSPYIIFAGIDASRALAKMSFKTEDLESCDLADLSDAELKVLDDWHWKYSEARKYPIVGTLKGTDTTEEM